MKTFNDHILFFILIKQSLFNNAHVHVHAHTHSNSSNTFL